MNIKETSENKFNQLYNHFYDKVIEISEYNKRESYNNLKNFIIAIMIVLMLNLILYYLKLFNCKVYNLIILFEVIFLLPVFIGIILTKHTQSIQKRIEVGKEIKQYLINDFESIFNVQIEYKKDEGILEQDFNILNLIKYDRYNNGDLFKFKNKNGIFCESSYVHLGSYDQESSYVRTNFYGNFSKFSIKNSNTKIYLSLKIVEKYNFLKNMIKLKTNNNINTFITDKANYNKIITTNILKMLEEFYDTTRKPFEILIDNNLIYIKIYNCQNFYGSFFVGNKTIKLDKEKILEIYYYYLFIFELYNSLNV